jgi:hypothetical protein
MEHRLSRWSVLPFARLSAHGIQTGDHCLAGMVKNNVFTALLFGKFLYSLFRGLQVLSRFHPHQSAVLSPEDVVSGYRHKKSNRQYFGAGLDRAKQVNTLI